MISETPIEQNWRFGLVRYMVLLRQRLRQSLRLILSWIRYDYLAVAQEQLSADANQY
jgi:hypothetical protein